VLTLAEAPSEAEPQRVSSQGWYDIASFVPWEWNPRRKWEKGKGEEVTFYIRCRADKSLQGGLR